MAFKMFSTGLVLAFAGMCLCQQQSTSSPIQYQSAAAVSQASYHTGSAAAQQPQTKLEDIERDTLAAAYGQKTQQPAIKPSSAVAPSVAQQQQPPQSYQAAVPQQQYFVQPYQVPQQQFYMQPFQVQQQQYVNQPYQMAFDFAGLQYSVVSPNSYPGNQIYQQYYVPAAQPSAVPQYVTKQSYPVAAPAQAQQEYKQQQFAVPTQVQQEYKQQPQFSAPAKVQQEYKLQQQQQFAAPNQAQQQVYKQPQQFAAPSQAQPQEYKQQQFTALGQAQQEYKQQQQQYVVPSPAYQYVQQPAAAAAAGGPADYSYVTRHPATTIAQFKAPAVAAQPQFQYNALPQQYQQPQQPQYYYTVAATEQPRVQQSAKSQFSSGVKSTTPIPLTKEPFAYKFESSPLQQQQQQSGATYSTLRYSA